MSSRASTPNKNVKVLAAMSPASLRMQQRHQMITTDTHNDSLGALSPMSAATTLQSLGVAVGGPDLMNAEGSTDNSTDNLAARLKQIDPEKLIEAGVLPPVEPGWTCKRCTYWNPETLTACEICTASIQGEINEGALVR
jgi:hypothetical protein